MSIERLAEENPDALLADGFEGAFLGPARRCGQKTLAAYSMRKALDILVVRDGMTYEEALEYFEFNVVGAWMDRRHRGRRVTFAVACVA